MMKKIGVSIPFMGLALCFGSVTAHAVPVAVDLNTWVAESYPAVSGFPAGNWAVSGDGSSVFQSANGQPTIFYSDFNAQGSKITGTISTASDGDDDFVGFVLGFNPNDSTNTAADYLLIDWKQGTQSFNFSAPSSSPGGNAPAGLAVSRATGIPDADEFWTHQNQSGTVFGSGLQELARGNTLANTGWIDNTVYEFVFDFGPNNLEVFVDDSLQLDIAGSFNDGRLGFYNFSQSQVTYAGFTEEAGSFPPGGENPPSTVPIPGTLALLGLGLAGFGWSRRKIA